MTSIIDSSNGIVYTKTAEYSLFRIETISDGLKTQIREHLSKICYGIADVARNPDLYSYENTVSEFLKLLKNKRDSQKIGFISELLAHLLIGLYFPEYEACSLYFNLEEKSPKKGFDIVMLNKNTNTLRYLESKGGQPNVHQTVDQKIEERLGEAHRDRINKMSPSNTQLWANAVKHAKNALEHESSTKDAVVKILEDCQLSATSGSYSTAETDVFLSGCIFGNMAETISESVVSNKQESLNLRPGFNSVVVMSIHKTTYAQVISFLESEVVSAE
jgi:hypothetical protein